MITADVKTLVEEVLDSMPKPYSNHVIDEVFATIEQNSNWLSRYNFLCSSLGHDVVNIWGGRWIAISLGKVGEQQVPSKKSKLIGSYSILDTDAKAKRPNRAEALQLMSNYYKSNKGSLPPSIQDQRELIVDLLLNGITVEDAFSEALKSGT